jgi:hypothetical protein
LPLLAIDAASELEGVRYTRDGYLIADVLVVKGNNVQLYSGAEVGRPDLKVVRVFRPEEEVFDAAAMASFAHRPVVLDHPQGEMLHSGNWRDFAVGFTGGDVARSGDFLKVPLALMDSAAIEAVKAEKRELSAGYLCDIEWAPGTTPDGQEFDAVQRRVRANHVAAVLKGRAGHECRIGDGTAAQTPALQPQAQGEHTVNNERTIVALDSGETVEVDRRVADTIASLRGQVVALRQVIAHRDAAALRDNDPMRQALVSGAGGGRSQVVDWSYTPGRAPSGWQKNMDHLLNAHKSTYRAA